MTASNNLTGDPQFVNPAANDFRVQPSSAAVNAGVTISGVMDDFNGLLRPRGSAYDIGAYEQ